MVRCHDGKMAVVERTYYINELDMVLKLQEMKELVSLINT
jgi:hypothetical protein